MKIELLIEESLKAWKEQEAKVVAPAQPDADLPAPLPDPFYQALEQRLRKGQDAKHHEEKHHSTFDLESLKDDMRQSRDQRKGILWHRVKIEVPSTSKKRKAKPRLQEVLIRDARHAITDISAIDSDQTYWYQTYVIKGLSYLHAAIRTLDEFQLLNVNTQTQLMNVFKHFYFLAKSYDGNQQVASLTTKLNADLQDCLRKAAATPPAVNTQAMLTKYSEYRVSLPSTIRRYPIITVGKTKQVGQYKSQAYFDARIPGLVDEKGRYRVNMTTDTSTKGVLRNYYFMVTGTIPRRKTQGQQARVTHIQGYSASVNDAHRRHGRFLAIPPALTAAETDDIAAQFRHSHTQVAESKKASVRFGLLTLITDCKTLEDRNSWNIRQSAFGVLKKLEPSYALTTPPYSNRPIDTRKNVFVGIDEGLAHTVLSYLSDIGKKSKEKARQLAFLITPTLPQTAADSYHRACAYIKSMSTLPQKSADRKSHTNPPLPNAEMEARKKLFAAAALYKAIHCNEVFQQGKVGTVQFPITTFLEEDPQAVSYPARQLLLGALECIMWYTLGGQAALDKHLLYLPHVTCKSGQRRTQLLLLQMKIMLRFYEVSQYCYLPDPTAEDYQDQKAIFDDICKRAIAEDVEATMVDRGSMNGNFSLHPSSIAAFPGYMDRAQLKKQIYLHIDPDSTSSTSSTGPKLGDPSFNIDKVDLAQYEIKVLDQLKKITLLALNRYLHWFRYEFGGKYGTKLYLEKHERPPTEGLLGKIWRTGNLTHGLNGYYNAVDLLETIKNWKTLNIACLSIRTYLKNSGTADHSASQFIRRELQIKENRPMAKFLLGEDLVKSLPVLTLSAQEQQDKGTNLVAIEKEEIKARSKGVRTAGLFQRRKIRDKLIHLDPKNLKFAP